MPKKIAFIGPLPPPIGGLALSIIRVQDIVARKAPQYTLVNLDNAKKIQNADLYKKKGKSELLHFLKNIVALFGFVFKHKIAIANVFVVPNISFIREAIYILTFKLFAKKVVVHLHAKTSGDLFLHGWRLKIFTKIVGLADVVFVLSQKHHKAFYAQYINPEKLVVLENFVDYSEFENNIKDKQNKFLYIGRLSEKKGFETLVDALIIGAEQLAGIQIEVIGAWENSEFELKIKAKISEHKLTQLNFHGPQMGESKFKHFKECSVFVFPSYFENSPIVLKEAIAAKMAIISSDIIENKNLLEDFNNKVHFKQKDPNDLAEKLLLLHQDEQRVQEMMLESASIKQYNISVAEQIIVNTLGL